MATVEDAQFHQLIRSHVGHESDADLFQRRPTERELVLQHPLLEFFAEDRPGIVDAVGVAGNGDLALTGCRRDAVDHGIGEGDVFVDPLGEIGVGQPGQAGDGRLCHFAIAGNVVAAHYGEGRNAGRAAALEAGDDQAEDALRMVRIEIRGRQHARHRAGHGRGAALIVLLDDGG